MRLGGVLAFMLCVSAAAQSVDALRKQGAERKARNDAAGAFAEAARIRKDNEAAQARALRNRK
jgi:hypothetical protein